MDMVEILRVVLGLGAVLSIIGVCALIAQRTGLATFKNAIRRERRLKLVETLAVDSRRKALVLQCDQQEYIVLTGPSGDLLIDNRLSTTSDVTDTPTAPSKTYFLSPLTKDAA